MSVEELDDDVYDKILELSKVGDEFQENKQYDWALQKYSEALALVPEPQLKWKASTWLLVAIGETYFFKGDYANAHDTLEEVMYYPEAIGNPFIHLRLGQAYFELGNLTRAADELVRAYTKGGEEIFSDEEGRYFDLVKQVINR